MKIFCMSDIHGCLEEFEAALSLIINDLKQGENKLILLGDYISRGPNSVEVINKIIDLQEMFGKTKVIALLGNHEEAVLDGLTSLESEFEKSVFESEKYIKWFKSLPRYYVLNDNIFVHAGIDEEAGELWELGTTDETFTMKYPASLGPIKDLNKRVVAGHIGTSSISKNSLYHGIFYDGYSHYYIDGDVITSHTIPILMIENDKYYEVTKSGTVLIQ